MPYENKPALSTCMWRWLGGVWHLQPSKLSQTRCGKTPDTLGMCIANGKIWVTNTHHTGYTDWTFDTVSWVQPMLHCTEHLHRTHSGGFFDWVRWLERNGQTSYSDNQHHTCCYQYHSRNYCRLQSICKPWQKPPFTLIWCTGPPSLHVR